MKKYLIALISSIILSYNNINYVYCKTSKNNTKKKFIVSNFDDPIELSNISMESNKTRFFYFSYDCKDKIKVHVKTYDVLRNLFSYLNLIYVFSDEIENLFEPNTEIFKSKKIDIKDDKSYDKLMTYFKTHKKKKSQNTLKFLEDPDLFELFGDSIKYADDSLIDIMKLNFSLKDLHSPAICSVFFNNLQKLDEIHDYFKEISHEEFDLFSLLTLNLKDFKNETFIAKIKNIKKAIFNFRNSHFKNQQNKSFNLKYSKPFEVFSINSIKNYENLSQEDKITLNSIGFSGKGYVRINANIDSLVNIEQIECCNNKIFELPNSISNLKQLQVFYACNNKLKYFIQDCKKLEKLYDLKLSNNCFNNFNKICEIKSLKCLNLSSNKINNISLFICNLENLEYLDLSNNQISFLPEELLQCKKLKYLILNNNCTLKISKIFIKFLSNLKCLDLRNTNIEFFGNPNILGLNEIMEIMREKVLLDTKKIDKIYDAFKSETVFFDFEKLKKSTIPSLPTTFMSKQELLTKINTCSAFKYNPNIKKNLDGKNNEEYIFMMKLEHLQEFINKIYNSNTTNLRHLDDNMVNFAKRMISEIVVKVFSLDDVVAIGKYLDGFLSYGYNISRSGISCLIRMYVFFLVEESKNLFDCLKNDLTFDLKEIENNLEFYIFHTIVRFVDAQKLEIFRRWFYDPSKQENLYSFGYWQQNLGKHIGINSFGIKSKYREYERFKGCQKNGMKAFYSIFTPEYLIEELHKWINKDFFFICKVLEYIDQSDIKHKLDVLECIDDNIDLVVGIKKEFVVYLLKKMELIKFK